MTDREYLKRLKELSVELERTGNARPYDPNAYNNVIDQLNRLFSSKSQLSARPMSIFGIMIWILLICLLIVIGLILW